jgi:PAS domain-containing protein
MYNIVDRLLIPFNGGSSFVENIQKTVGLAMLTAFTYYLDHYNVINALGSALLLVTGMGYFIAYRKAKKASSKATLDEAFLRAILDNTPTSVFVKDSPTSYIFVNKAYQQLVDRYKKQQDLWPKTRLSWFPFEEEVLFSGKPHVYRNTYSNVEGQVRSVDVHLARFKLPTGKYALIGLLKDTSDVVRYMSDLKISEEKYRILVENINYVTLTFDPQYNITYCSPQSSATLGISNEDLLNTDFRTLLSVDSTMAFMDRLNAHNPFTLTAKSNNIKTEYLDISCTPIKTDSTTSWNCVIKDNTIKVRLRKELELKNKMLISLANSLKLMFKSSNIQEDLSTVLRYIGNAILSEHVYLAKIQGKDPNKYLNVVAEWCLPEHESIVESNPNKSLFYDRTFYKYWDGTPIAITPKHEFVQIFPFINGFDRQILVPVFNSKKLWGIISFAFTSVKHDIFTEEELAILMLISENVGAAISICEKNTELSLLTAANNRLLQTLLKIQTDENELFREGNRVMDQHQKESAERASLKFQ